MIEVKRIIAENIVMPVLSGVIWHDNAEVETTSLFIFQKRISIEDSTLLNASSMGHLIALFI